MKKIKKLGSFETDIKIGQSTWFFEDKNIEKDIYIVTKAKCDYSYDQDTLKIDVSCEFIGDLDEDFDNMVVRAKPYIINNYCDYLDEKKIYNTEFEYPHPALKWSPIVSEPNKRLKKMKYISGYFDLYDNAVEEFIPLKLQKKWMVNKYRLLNIGNITTWREIQKVEHLIDESLDLNELIIPLKEHLPEWLDEIEDGLKEELEEILFPILGP